MKTRNIRRHHPVRRRRRRRAYPNAAASGYFAEKFLDAATAVVSCAGLMTAMFFLITM